MSDTILLFKDLGLSKDVLAAVTAVGYEQPSPIQAAAIPLLLEGKDIVGMAQTGTGKTAAFALPLLSKIDLKQKQPQILVLTPTRELAIQVAEAFQRYASEMKGFHVLPIYGGQEMRGQLRQLTRGAHVIVGTPGRVMDHLRRGSLKLNELTNLVLDEADEMLRMGFIDDVEWILSHTPASRQTALFSATMPKEIRKVAQTYLRNPEEIRIASEAATGENIDQVYWMVSGTQKLDALTRILEVEPFEAIIIFVRTKTATVELAEKLEARGYSAAAINGDMNQTLRERTIERLKKKNLDILVATDVAARGIDVERVSHVINYDIPYDSEAYVHRIGRTGRAGRSGKAILFVAPREKRLLYAIEKTTRQRIKAMELPTGATVTAARIDQFKQTITDALSGQEDLSFYSELLENFSKEHEVDPSKVAAALVYLLQKDRPLQVTLQDIKPAIDRDRGRDRERSNSRSGSGSGSRSNNGACEEGMTRYRIEVGRDHHVRPGDIVGAVANEGGLQSRQIGHIKLFDKFSTLDLPNNLSEKELTKIKSIRVRGNVLNIAPDRSSGSSLPQSERPPRRAKPRSGGNKEGAGKGRRSVAKKS